MAQKILDTLRSKGVLTDSVQEKLMQFIPENGIEKLSSIVQRYQELNDEEKQQFLNDAFVKLKDTLQDENNSDSNVYSRFLYSPSYTVFFFAVLLIVFVLVFFVYKLFKCLREREAKREEKKKNKELKKKK